MKGGTPKKKFTDHFKLGDRVSVIRDQHGWYDGTIGGLITFIDEHSCNVTIDDDFHKHHLGEVLTIYKVRDIRK